MHEWSLFVFTLALQLSIGSICIYTFLKLVVYKNKNLVNEKIFFSTLSGFSLIGLIASFTHLGSPSNAINTINNFTNSWMSKEIVFTSGFIGILILLTVLILINNVKFTSIGLVLASMVGLVDVYCMAKIYETSLISGWDSIHTFTSFFSTTIILGTCMMLVFSIKELKAKTTNLSILLFANLVIGLAIYMLGLFFLPSSLVDPIIIGTTPAIMQYDALTTLNIIRLILGFIGLGFIFYLNIKKENKIVYPLLFTSIVLLVVSETIGRYIFFTFVS